MDLATTRRKFLQLAAAVPFLAAADHPAFAGEALIGRLIKEARAYAKVSQRIDFISRSLLGIKYQANTLIGGPRHPEVFVVRDDAFDCVTFCEVVLAAAIAKDLAEFETSLRRIRYEHGQVRWEERNHLFADWSRRIVENQICQPVAMADTVVIDKTVDGEVPGRRRVSILAVPQATFLASRHLLTSGDVVGFVSRRPNLDFFHTGLVAFGKNNTLLLRHASQRLGRIVDEPMETFLGVNGVKYVTLLRAIENPPLAG